MYSSFLYYQCLLKYIKNLKSLGIYFDFGIKRELLGNRRSGIVLKKFEEDLIFLMKKLTQDIEKEENYNLSLLKDQLIQLHRKNIIKINHSVMELVCAKYLILKGFKLLLEHPLSGILTCDIYAVKGFGSLIVEIETGFIPPEHALDPLTYTTARLASKIIRYSRYCEKFALGIPPHYVLTFPGVLALPPRERPESDMNTMKNLCDLYYHNPPINLEEIKHARIHSIYIINVDLVNVQEIDPDAYSKKFFVNNLKNIETYIHSYVEKKIRKRTLPS